MQVWCASVAQQLRDAGDPWRWLSPGEHARLAGLHAPRRRDQFIAGRWLLRQAIAALRGGAPEDWSLSAQADAAPRVDGGPRLGLAHSADLVACVLADHAVGIDIECLGRREFDVAALAEMALNKAERDRVLTAADDARLRSFLASWTLKEAWIKSGADWPDLPRIDTAPATEADGNARLWQAASYTLAIVGTDGSSPVVVKGSQAPQCVPEVWWVGITSA